MHRVRAAVTLLLALAICVSTGSHAIADDPAWAETSGTVTESSAAAQASYKRQVESVELGTRGLADAATSAGSAAAGTAGGASGERARTGTAALPGCYNHILSSESGQLRYGHICPGYGGYEGGQAAELFGVGEIVLRDPATGQITGRIPASEVTGGASSVTVSSALLAEFALAELTLPSPIIGMSPYGDQVVQLASWLWIDRAQWSPRDRTATAGPVSATVTATPVRVEWDMGDGETVVCDGPGRVYRPRFEGRPDVTDCKHVYRHSSASQADAVYDMTTTVVWEASWSGSDGDGGDLGELTSRTTEAVRVAEVQALVQ